MLSLWYAIKLSTNDFFYVTASPRSVLTVLLVDSVWRSAYCYPTSFPAFPMGCPITHSSIFGHSKNQRTQRFCQS